MNSDSVTIFIVSIVIIVFAVNRSLRCVYKNLGICGFENENRWNY